MAIAAPRNPNPGACARLLVKHCCCRCRVMFIMSQMCTTFAVRVRARVCSPVVHLTPQAPFSFWSPKSSPPRVAHGGQQPPEAAGGHREKKVRPAGGAGPTAAPPRPRAHAEAQRAVPLRLGEKVQALLPQQARCEPRARGGRGCCKGRRAPRRAASAGGPGASRAADAVERRVRSGGARGQARVRGSNAQGGRGWPQVRGPREQTAFNKV